MKLKITILLLVSQFMNAQDSIKMTTKYGSKIKEVEELMSFQGIGLETLTFESPEIIGKCYEINIKEFKNGELIDTKQLFNGIGHPAFKIKSSKNSFRFFTKIDDEKLETSIKADGFGSKKLFFKLEIGNGKYVLKDFQGINKFLKEPLNDEFPILGIITATVREDGFHSYCDVAQSNVKPEKFGEVFKIPHYFIVYIKFKEFTE